MTATEEPGLRERKRLATRRSIQFAVLDLAAERGLDGVTVDEISRVADISPRTFFNYFPSKEAAVLGDPPTVPLGPEVDLFLSGEGEGVILEDLATLIMATAESTMFDVELVKRRNTILKAYPDLFAARMATMRTFEAALADLVAVRVRAVDAALDDERVAERSRLITLVALAAMRHAWTNWVSHDAHDALRFHLEKSFTELGLLLRQETA